MPYTQYTQAQLAGEISQSLADPSNVYWALDEIKRTINEALLYWGALTSYWRDTGSFQTTALTGFYDLSVQLPTLRTRNYTFGQLVTELQYHLLEPPNGVSGTGMTDQFTIQQLTNALARKRNEFLLDAALPLVFQNFPSSSPQAGRVQLDESIALIARAAWKDALSGVYTVLRRQDEWSAQSYNPTWNLEPATPFAYSMAETRPIELQLIPPPLSSGALSFVFAQSLSLTAATGTSFALPDEFVSAIKWGALYTLLSTDNQAFDPTRAQYALERYQACITTTQLQRSVVRVRVNNVPVPLDTFWSMDAARPFWQNRPARPDLAGTAFDLLALANIPDSAYGITVELVRTAPLPVLPTDFIQIGREEMPYIIDYCRHVLSFKLGGSEFTSTMPLYDNFLAGAASRNTLLADKAKYLTPLFGAGKQEAGVAPAA